MQLQAHGSGARGFQVPSTLAWRLKESRDARLSDQIRLLCSSGLVWSGSQRLPMRSGEGNCAISQYKHSPSRREGHPLPSFHPCQARPAVPCPVALGRPLQALLQGLPVSPPAAVARSTKNPYSNSTSSNHFAEQGRLVPSRYHGHADVTLGMAPRPAAAGAGETFVGRQSHIEKRFRVRMTPLVPCNTAEEGRHEPPLHGRGLVSVARDACSCTEFLETKVLKTPQVPLVAYSKRS